MNDKSLRNEIFVSVFFIIILVLFLDPFMILMPGQMIYLLIAVALALFVLFVGFVWKERPKDERDELHRMVAGRIGYLLGTLGLLTGVIFQSINGHVDPWLVVGIGFMVLGKIVGLYWSRKYK